MEIKQALGFIGLIAVVVLILIYLLKPNYQQKVISSTFLWKLSLKYKRKKIPVNRIRQLLLFICQILLLVVAVLVLTRPHLLNTAELPKNERIIVIDGSASMLASVEKENGETETRFDRAIEEARALSRDTINTGGTVTVILADNDPAYALTDSRATAARLKEISLVEQALKNIECSFGQADIQGAMDLASEILESNYTAKTTFITATVYQGVDDVDIIDVSLRDNKGVRTERNAAILNAEAIYDEGYFMLRIEVVNYNNEDGVLLSIVVEDAEYNILVPNGVPITSDKPETVRYVTTVLCTPGEVRVVELKSFFTDTGEEYQIFAFSSILLNVEIDDDCFAYDNDFSVYGGKRQDINVLYVSKQPHDFIGFALGTIVDGLYEKWNISVENTYYDLMEEFVGYDFYIFEHTLPSRLPSDGVSFVIDPDKTPADGGFLVDNSPSPLNIGGDTLSAGDAGMFGDAIQILENIKPSNMKVSSYKSILSVSDPDIQQVMGIRRGDSFEPLLLVKNTPDSKFAILSFDLHYSNLPVLFDFPTLMLNLFNYFIPTTITKNVNEQNIASRVFDVGEDVVLNARGSKLEVSSKNGFYKDVEFPESISFELPGDYEVKQTLLNRSTITERFFVRINETQSNFNRIDTFVSPNANEKQPGLDLILYIAAALVALLFIERILYIREEF